jgi:hypothetical protein
MLVMKFPWSVPLSDDYLDWDGMMFSTLCTPRDCNPDRFEAGNAILRTFCLCHTNYSLEESPSLWERVSA